MSEILKIEKVISSLPTILSPNTIYIVRVGTGYEMHVTDLTGAVAHKLNDTNITTMQTSINELVSAFTRSTGTGKNKYNPALAENAKLVSYSTGLTVDFANGISFGKQNVIPGNTYTFSLPTAMSFTLQTYIYTYSSNDTFLGLSKSVPSVGEVVNSDPPTNIVFSNANREVTFTIPANSAIAKVQFMIVYKAHTLQEFNDLVNNCQMEIGSTKTSFEAYNPNNVKLTLNESALPEITTLTNDQFTLTIDGIDAYIRTQHSSTHDLVQCVRFGSNLVWSNNVINAQSARLILKSVSRTGVVAAYNSSTSILASQGDDSTPMYYNNTYIGANHGANIVHEVTQTNHGKTNVDVGSKWGANYTLVRVVDANKLWLVAPNTGSTTWNFSTTSIQNTTLTHVSGATNTNNIFVSSSTIVQLLSAVNKHTKKIIVDGLKEVSISGVYNVKSVDFVDSYEIMNPASILSYLQGKTGTVTEINLSNDSISTDVKVTTTYSYALNGSVTINTQTYFRSVVNLAFIGYVQAGVLTYTGKSLFQYIPKLLPITASSKIWNFSDVEDITTTIDSVNFLKANWSNTSSPPDRMVQLVKNGTTKEFGQVIGYNIDKGNTLNSIRNISDNAGFVHTTRKMYPKAVTGNMYPSNLVPADTTLNNMSYRSFYNLSDKQEFTTNTWFYDNGDYYYVLDIHQTLNSYAIQVPHFMVGRYITIIDSNSNFELKSSIVSDDGIFIKVNNNYGYAILKLSENLNKGENIQWVDITTVGTVASFVSPSSIQVARHRGLLYLRGTFSVTQSVAIDSELFKITNMNYKPYAYSSSGNARNIMLLNAWAPTSTVAKLITVTPLGNITNGTQASAIDVSFSAKSTFATTDSTINIPAIIIGSLVN